MAIPGTPKGSSAPWTGVLAAAVSLVGRVAAPSAHPTSRAAMPARVVERETAMVTAGERFDVILTGVRMEGTFVTAESSQPMGADP
jgi:hypothetical protein